MTNDNKPRNGHAHRPTVGVLGTGAGVFDALAMLQGRPPTIAAIVDPIDAPADLAGEHGRAWRCDLAAGIKQTGADPAQFGSLEHWLIEAPRCHPAWHSYAIFLVHLRPIAGKATLFYLEGATHEIQLWALDPAVPREPYRATGIVSAVLHPINYAGQFIEISDQLARDRVARAVNAICVGALSPDTDWLPTWFQLFGDHMLKGRGPKAGA